MSTSIPMKTIKTKPPANMRRLPLPRGKDRGKSTDATPSQNAASAAPAAENPQSSKPKSPLSFLRRRLSPEKPLPPAPDNRLDEIAKQAREDLQEALARLSEATRLSLNLVFGSVDDGDEELGPVLCHSFVSPEVTRAFAVAMAATVTVTAAVGLAQTPFAAPHEIRETKQRHAKDTAYLLREGSVALSRLPRFCVGAVPDQQALRVLMSANMSMLQVAERVELVVKHSRKKVKHRQKGTSFDPVMAAEQQVRHRALDAVQSASTVWSCVHRSLLLSLEDAIEGQLEPAPASFPGEREAAHLAVHESVHFGSTVALKYILWTAEMEKKPEKQRRWYTLWE